MEPDSLVAPPVARGEGRGRKGERGRGWREGEGQVKEIIVH